MKAAAKSLLLLSTLAATFAAAQQPNTPFKHVIIVIQENRTPDNLFGSDAQSGSQLPGADLATQANCNGTVSARTAYTLNGCFDPDHGHGWNHPYHDAWLTTYDKGKMDGACAVTLWCGPPGQRCPYKQCNPPTNATDTYVDNSNLNVQPYFDIAKNYGYANYMFQTNQGPSFEAHQFLFTGTSAPDYYNDPNSNCGSTYPCYKWFAAENQKGSNWGCTAGYGANIVEIDPSGNESTGVYNSGFPCYEHNTLSDLLDQNNITWKYYPQGKPGMVVSSLWTAPNAIYHICEPKAGNLGDICTGTDWVDNVVPEIPPNPAQADMMAPILEDIENCNLPGVSWVIPDGSWSDHAGEGSDIKGPAWVAAIVDAVGGPATNECASGESLWKDTVILVVWDDWGGWYDHVLPWNCLSNGACSGYPDGLNDTGQYIYGFRVPLLVVSAYNYRATGSTGYISGACVAQGNCPNDKPPYVHDFGSILNFTEWALGQNQQPLSWSPQTVGQGINPSYFYADYWAPDGPVVCGTSCPHPFSLSDFFVDLSKNPTPTPFTPISLPPVLCNNTVCYNAEWFEDFNGTPTDPDDDAMEQ